MHAVPPTYTLSDFDFDLPPELVAQHPAAERSASRLLDATVTPPADRRFRDLPSLLRAGDLLVVNDTRVIRARLFGTKASGGAVEALVERVLPGHEVLAHLRASKSPRPGTWLRLADAFDAQVLGRGNGDRGPADAASGSLFRLRFPDDPFSLLERHGHVPLPPYITHADAAEDAERYQTVFAQRPGAVAAPTAALHFDAGLIAALRERGVQMASVTLHVGAGTFQPVRTEKIAEHTMHREWFEVTAATVDAIERTRAAGGRVVAVGTTSLRALESAAAGFVGAGIGAAGSAAPSGSATQPGSAAGTDRGTETVRELTAGTGAAGEPNRSTASPRLRAGSGETGIFITPGFEFRVVDLLVTNFHLPRSTLMMLVSAFSGHAQVMALYRHAVDQRYRFFSYGDAMLLQRSA